jgi:hypothetical protein
MDLVGLIIWLAIGAIAGWLAGQIMKGGGYGLVSSSALSAQQLLVFSCRGWEFSSAAG